VPILLINRVSSRDVMEMWRMDWHPISQTSALDFTFGRYGTRICEKVWCGGAGGAFLRLKSLVLWMVVDSMIPRDLV
jgi:hypothetical protein